MKDDINLPADVERRLTECASAMGYDVVYLIRAAVVRLVDEKARPLASREWSDELQTRCSELINRGIAGTIMGMGNK